MSFFEIILPLLPLPPISLLLQTLINQYLSDSYCLTLLMDKPIDFKTNINFMYVTPNYSTIDDLTAQLLEVSEKGCSDYIVYMSDPQMFMAAFDQTNQQGNARRSDRKIIFLPFNSDADYVNKSLQLFSMRESTYVAKMLLVLPKNQMGSNCELYDLFTHEFVSLLHDQPLYLDQWDSCTQKFVKNVNLFPHDLKNLNGRVLRVTGFTYQPYAYFNLDPALEPSRRDGLDVRVVDEFCRWINCTVEIIDEEIHQWGTMYENGTGVGIVADMTLDLADIGITGIYPWYEEYLFLDFSASYTRSSVTCIAPSPRVLASWDMPLLPFSWHMWYAVITTFIIAYIGLKAAKSYKEKIVLFTLFGMMLSQAQPYIGNAWRIRSITVWVLGGSLILGSAYGAGLASTFTVPKYEPSIDTIQDLVDRKLEWGGTFDAWIYSFKLSNEPLVKQLVKQFRVYSDEELKKKSLARNYAFSIEKLPGSYAIGDYINKENVIDLTIMLEDFYFGNIVMLLRKSSVYTEKLNVLIGRLQESGLSLAWENQVSLKYQNFKVQQAVKLSRSTTTDSGGSKALGLHQVVGIYIGFLLSIGLATLVFLVEYFTNKLVKRTGRKNYILNFKSCLVNRTRKLR